MENKYYTPSIEDIRVGYECEIKAANHEGEVWGKKIIAQKSLSSYLGGHQFGWIRTPYLTKEQIEAEGWIFGKQTKFNTFYTKGEYRLETVDNGTHGIYIWVDDETGGGIVFQGIVPSINELRYISKLIGI